MLFATVKILIPKYNNIRHKGHGRHTCFLKSIIMIMIIIVVVVISTEIAAYEYDTTASLKEYSGIFFPVILKIIASINFRR